jgi:hypothetical protein
VLQSNVREDIHRVTNDDHHGSRVLVVGVADDVAYDGGVPLQKRESRLAGSLCGPCCNNDHVGVGEVEWLPDTDGNAWEEGLTVRQIKNLPPGKVLISIDKDDFICQSTLSKSIAERGPNGPGADHDNFAIVPSLLMSHGFLLAEVPCRSRPETLSMPLRCPCKADGDRTALESHPTDSFQQNANYVLSDCSSVLWVPSQNGTFPVRLHMHNHASPDFSATKTCGVNEVTLCEPSQKG